MGTRARGATPFCAPDRIRRGSVRARFVVPPDLMRCEPGLGARTLL